MTWLAFSVGTTLHADIFPADLALIESMQAFPERIDLGDPDVAAASGIEGPKGVAEGDLREDGTLDDIAVSNLDGTVTVLLGTRGGDLEVLHLRSNASSLRGIIIADIDGNGTQDILTAAPFEGEVFVFYNGGNARFADAETIPAARVRGVRNLAAADFDGDGVLDLAIAGPGLGVRHLRGLGNGQFHVAGKLPQLSPVGVRFPKPVYSLRPVPAMGGLRHDLAVIHAESDELFILSTIGEEESGNLKGKGGRQDLPVNTEDTPILITEFMASNTGTLLDENGNPSDWIEIYNRSSEPVSLGQWYLANHYLFQDTWQFPKITLSPGEFKIVFASGLNKRLVGQELHTSFKLSTNNDKNLEALSLWEGTNRRHVFPAAIDEVYYPEQVENISYGLSFNGNEQFFQMPSPGRVNNRGYDSLGDISLAEVVAWEAKEGPETVRLNVRFSDISRLSSVWLASNRGTTRRYWSMQAVDRATSMSYTVNIPARFFDPEAPLEIVARRKDGRIRPVTIDLEGDEPPKKGALRLVASLAARSGRSLDVGHLLTPVEADTGVVDLVLANRDSGYIEIHRGVTDVHRFEPSPYATFQVEGAPRAVRIADINGDGWNDLLVALRNADKMIVLRNEEGAEGERIFVTDRKLEIPVGLSPREIAVVDANGDGKEDALVINRVSGDLSVLLTVDDDITFSKLDHVYDVDGHVAALTVLDFNGDGRDDVVLTHRATGDFSIRLARPDGTLGAPEYFAAGEEPNDTEFEDCDEDGDEDAIVALLNGEASIAVRLRETNGSFGPITTYRAPQDVDVGDLLCVTTADFDGDGHLDIAAGYFDCRLTFFRGDGKGTFEAGPVNDFTDEPRDIIPGDFDGDGDTDLATVNFSGEVVILENKNGRIMNYDAREFAMAKRIFPLQEDPMMLHLDARDVRKVDLNNDAFDDLVAATGNGIRYLLGKPVISEMEAVSVLNEAVSAMTRADFDGNGVDDVAVACKERSCVKFLSMEGGVLREQVSVGVPGVRFLAQGDVDGDGKPDIIGVGDVLWTALSSRAPRPVEDVEELTERPALSKPVINEILARNSNIPLLVDRDKQADYVELYNSSPETISLGGWRLQLIKTDGEEEIYEFPPDSFEPDAHRLVIFSSSKRSHSHTGFKLPGDGATVRLSDDKGNMVDEVTYPPQQKNVAYSRYRDGLPTFIFNPLPTPNGPNRDGGVIEPQLTFAGFDAASVQAGEPLRFTVHAADDIGIVSVWVSFLRLDRLQDGVRKLVLFDTGMHGDGERGDGIYSNVLNALPAGAEIHFYIEALDLTGAKITFPDEPVLSLDGKNQDVLALGIGHRIDLAITEFVSNNDGLLPGENAKLDYIEVTNRGLQSIGLEGISLADRFLAGPGDIFDFPPGSSLHPGESIVVLASGDSTPGRYHAPFGISNDENEQIVLLGTAESGARTVIDAVTVLPLQKNEAYYRVGEVWFKGTASPNQPNPAISGDRYGFNHRGKKVWTAIFDAMAGVFYKVERSDGSVVVDAFEGRGSLVSVNLEPGESGTLKVLTLPPGRPTFDWQVDSVTKRTAEISGVVTDTGGKPPALHFYYDTIDRGRRIDDWAHHHILPGTHSDQFRTLVRQLLPGQNYIGRMMADNGTVPVWSAVLNVKTLAETMPVITVQEIDEVTTIDAQCEVAIKETGRLPAEVTLFWGATDGGVDSDAWEFSRELGVGELFESTLDGLKPGQRHFVRARASNEDGKVWTAETVSFTTMNHLEALKQFLIVSEFMYHPIEPTPQEKAFGYRESDFEWIELFNHGPVPLELSDVRVQNAVDFAFAFDADVTVIEPQGFMVIAANREAFVLRYGETIPIAGQWCGPFNCGNLSNDGLRSNGESDTIVLTYQQKEAFVEIAYQDAFFGLWPDGPDGNGVTLEASPQGTLIPPDDWSSRDWSNPGAWAASAFIGRTPGSFAPPGALDPEIQDLHEGLLVTRIAPFGEEEFIELTNISNVVLDLRSIRIDDDVRFSFADAFITELAPGASVYVVRNTIRFQRAYGSGLPVAGEFDRKLSPGGRLVITAAGVDLIDFVSPFDSGPFDSAGPPFSVFRLDVLAPGVDLADPRNWTGLEFLDKSIQFFSPRGGLHTEPIDVALTAGLSGDSVIYTLDETLPSAENGAEYRDTIFIDRSAALFARIGDGPVRSEAYILLDDTFGKAASLLSRVVIDTMGKPIGTMPSSSVLGFSNTVSYGEIYAEDSDAAKPSFHLKLKDALNRDVPRSLLGLPTGSQWVLKAQDSSDLSLIREAFAYELSRQLGRWAPRVEFVEVYVNQDGDAVGEHDYLGVYSFTESLKPGSDRLDIEELSAEETQMPGISGGYLFKKNSSDAAKAFDRLYPPPLEEGRDHQQQWLEAFLEDVASALVSADPYAGYPAYIDVGSWIDHHLLHVLMANLEGLRDHAYFHKNRSRDLRLPGRLKAGPIWNFEGTAGALKDDRQRFDVWTDSAGAFGYFQSHASGGLPACWNTLFEHADFQQAWGDRWQALRRSAFSTENIRDIVRHLRAQLGQAPARNFERWPERARDMPFGHLGETEAFQEWLEQRLSWIDGQLIPEPSILPQENEHEGSMMIHFDPGTAPEDSAEVYFTMDGTDPRVPGGEISLQALNQNHVELTESVTIVARTRHENHPLKFGGPRLVWSAPVRTRYYIGTASPDVDNVTISELMYHPSPVSPEERAKGFEDDDAFEYVEFWNRSGKAVDLTGVRVSEAFDFTFPQGVVLSAGEYAVLVKDVPAFRARYGNDARILGEYGGEGTLSNKGESLRLTSFAGDTLLDIFYNDDWWPETDGGGWSWNTIDAQSGNWYPSIRLLGTPGRADPAAEMEFSWPYREWISENFSLSEAEDLAITGLDADPDGDGLVNHEEFAFETHPQLPNGSPVEVRLMDGNFTHVRYPVRSAGLRYSLEVSSDLKRWQNGEDFVFMTTQSKHDGRILRSHFIEQESGHRYFRVRYAFTP